MKVKYISDLGFYDGLTKGETYTVIEEIGTSYVVANDLGGTSKVHRSKFEVKN